MVNSFSDVFITDGHWRKTLAATRALGRSHVGVTVGESTALSMAAFSKYCRSKIVYPSPLINPEAFIAYLYDLVSHHAFRMLLPMEDETTRLLAEHRDTFARLTYLPVTTVKKLQKAHDKAQVLQMAESIGIPVPKTWHINRLSQLDNLKNVLPYPVVIKPRDSSGATGIAYPGNPNELMRQYPIIHRRFPFPLIQERIPRSGTGYGASFLFDENTRVRASFVHMRLREYPVSGGASTLRVSVRHDEIRDMACALLKSLGWFGVAMVEFKVDPRDGVPKLMEINPRFWGSLALAIHSGVNFPHLLFKMAAGERFVPVESYRLGLKCRWLLPGDILHFLSNPDRRRIASEFFRLREPGTCYDIVSLKDPMPALIRVLTPLTFLYDPDMQLRLRKRRQ